MPVTLCTIADDLRSGYGYDQADVNCCRAPRIHSGSRRGPPTARSEYDSQRCRRGVIAAAGSVVMSLTPPPSG